MTYAPERAELTYGDLDALANRWAHLLAAHGVGRGDVVAVVARNGIPVVAAYYGALKLGAAFTVVNPGFRAHEAAWQLAHAEPTVVLADPAFADPAATLPILARDRVTVLAQTPTFYLALAAQPGFGPETVGAVRRCLTYGGQVAPAAIEAWSVAAPEARWGTYWGQSELSQLGTVGWFARLSDIPGDGDPSWIGKPVSHLEVRVVDEDGNDAELGELICRSPSVMLGYHRDPERTAAVLASGWLRTGDIVRVDAEGNLFFHDRRTDVIKSGGVNVSSQEVERVLHGHPEVLRAAVVGRPDAYWSEAVTAFVIPRLGRQLDPDAVIAFCRERLAGFKVPKTVHVVAELPVDAHGKIRKRELR